MRHAIGLRANHRSFLRHELEQRQRWRLICKRRNYANIHLRHGAKKFFAASGLEQPHPPRAEARTESTAISEMSLDNIGFGILGVRNPQLDVRLLGQRFERLGEDVKTLFRMKAGHEPYSYGTVDSRHLPIVGTTSN